MDRLISILRQSMDMEALLRRKEEYYPHISEGDEPADNSISDINILFTFHF